VRGRGWGKGGEMTQTLYVHMIFKKKREREEIRRFLESDKNENTTY
jgi:hypothetical protein